MAQTRREIQALLASAGIRPLKRFGQNFLIDGNLLGKLVAAADVRAGDVVLEVGPGTGVLTERLLESHTGVIAVEIDRGMQAICRERFGENPHFTLIPGDILAGKHRISPEVLEMLAAREPAPGRRRMMVANLPYQVATPLVVELLMGELAISPLCFTVQAEVAERFLAGPGSKDYGPISVFAQVLAEGERIARVPPEAFWPSPTVNSAMVRLDRRVDRPAGEVIVALRELVHACFNHRRKTMRSNLRGRWEEETIVAAAEAGGWRPEDRPEMLAPWQWLGLAEFAVRFEEEKG